MNLLKIFSFLKNYGDDLAFIVIFLVVAFFFLKEFKITSKSSWGVLLGLTALGGLFTYRVWKRRKLLEELERREQALKELEKRYEELKANHLISEAAYNEAKSNLDRAKVDAATGVLKADEEHAQAVSEIERDYQNISGEDVIKRAKRLIQS